MGFKKLSSKLLALVTMMALMVSLSVPAFATDGTGENTGDDSTQTTPVEVNYLSDAEYNVKNGASNVLNAIEKALKDDAYNNGYEIKTITFNPSNPKFTSDTEIQAKITYNDDNYQTIKVKTMVVNPDDYKFSRTLSSLRATSSENSSSSKLLTYVNSQLDLIPSGSDFDSALGTAPTYKAAQFKWSDSDMQYMEAGGVTYTFTQNYNGVTISREVTVDIASNSAPSVRVDYDEGTVNTTSDMQYSVDGTSGWKNCSETMKVPANWYGKYVSFKYPASKYRDESPSTEIYIPEKQDAPTTTLEVSSNSHSITIENCWDYDDAEFSIDDGNWRTTSKSTYTFDNLSANTTYKVSVRYSAVSGKYFASASKTVSIKTGEKIDTKVDVDYSKSKGVGTVRADITIASTITNKLLTKSLSTNDLSRFKTITSGYNSECDSIETSMYIDQYKEDNESKEVIGSKLTLALSPLKVAIEHGGLFIKYNCDLMTIDIDNSDLSYYIKKGSSGNLVIEVSEVASVSGSKYDWLDDEIDDGRPAYKLSVKNGSYSDTDVTYSIPYKLKNNETVAGLSVYYVDSKGNKSSVSFEYDTIKGRVEFSTSDSGYFVISHTRVTNPEMNFSDVPNTFWGYTYIEYCYNKGIFNGVGNNRFDPSGIVSRAQIVTLLARLDGKDTAESIAKSVFNDVDLEDWYAFSANWAYENKLVSGKTFNPDNSMTRLEIAEMLYKYLSNKKDVNGDASYKVDYTDISKVNGSGKKAISYLTSLGIMNGKNNNEFDPSGNLTRAEMSALMYRLADYVG